MHQGAVVGLAGLLVRAAGRIHLPATTYGLGLGVSLTDESSALNPKP